MTANKPEVVAWSWAYRGRHMATTDYSQALELAEPPYPTEVEPLIRLSDYEALQADRDQQYDMKVKTREQRDAVTAKLNALQAECEKLRKDTERYRGIAAAVLREHPHRNHNRGNAPGHGHSIPGVWDEDNGALAGKECAWCKTWNEALAAMQENKP